MRQLAPLSARGAVVLTTLTCPAQTLSFADQAAASGLIAPHQTAGVASGNEFMSAGGAVGDFNHDGRPDLLVTNGIYGPYFENDPTHLFLNNDGLTFSDVAPSLAAFAAGCP